MYSGFCLMPLREIWLQPNTLIKRKSGNSISELQSYIQLISPQGLRPLDGCYISPRGHIYKESTEKNLTKLDPTKPTICHYEIRTKTEKNQFEPSITYTQGIRSDSSELPHHSVESEACCLHSWWWSIHFGFITLWYISYSCVAHQHTVITRWKQGVCPQPTLLDTSVQ